VRMPAGGFAAKKSSVAASGDLPDGQISKNRVQPLLKKYSDFQKTQISNISSPSRPDRGALAIVTNAGRDAVDAGGATDERTDLADGEDVWS
jgi:hypothetical protein